VRLSLNTTFLLPEELSGKCFFQANPLSHKTEATFSLAQSVYLQALLFSGTFFLNIFTTPISFVQHLFLNQHLANTLTFYPFTTQILRFCSN